VKTSVLIKAHHQIIILWKNVKIMGVASSIICLVFLMCFNHARLPVKAKYSVTLQITFYIKAADTTNRKV